MTRVLIVLAGELVSKQQLAYWQNNSDVVIAADGGLRSLLNASLKPNYLIGDLDGVSSAEIQQMGDAAVISEDEQNTTDFQKSIAFAIQNFTPAEIMVCGAVGSRLDHVLATLAATAGLAKKARIRLAVGDQIAEVLTAGSYRFSAELGSLVSVMPLPVAEVASSTGFKWPLPHSLSLATNAVSISNEAAAGELTLEISEGIVAFFHPSPK